VNQAEKCQILLHVLSVLKNAKQPMPVSEIFVGCGPISRSWQVAVMRTLATGNDVVLSRRKGEDCYFPSSNTRIQTALKEVSGDLASYTKENGGDVRNSYAVSMRELNAKVAVATRGLRRLSQSTSPMIKRNMFVPKKGDRYQERVARIPTWQNVLIDGLVEKGYLKLQGEGAKITLEILNKEEIQKLIDGQTEPCLFTLINPNDPCKASHGQSESPEKKDEESEDEEDETSAGPPMEEKIAVVEAELVASTESSVAPSSEEKSDHAVAEILSKILDTLKSQNSIFKILGENVDKTTRRLDTLEGDLVAMNGHMIKFEMKLDLMKSDLNNQIRTLHENQAKSIEQKMNAVSATNAAGHIQAAEKSIELLRDTVVEPVLKEIRMLTTALKDDRRRRADAIMKRLSAATDEVEVLQELTLEALTTRKSS